LVTWSSTGHGELLCDAAKDIITDYDLPAEMSGTATS
jgi:hypothetical protein